MMKIAQPVDDATIVSRPAVQAAVLLEVLLALMLFAAAAAVVTTAFNSSMMSLSRQAASVQAVNLAASVLAEVQLGIRPGNSESSRPFDPPFDDWTWQTSLSPVETTKDGMTGLTRVEVIIRHRDSSAVQRLAQVLQLPGTEGTNTMATTTSSQL